MPLQDEVWAGLFLRNSRALAISIIAMVSLVSRATAALATPLQGVHDTFHKALRDGDAAVLDQLLAVQFELELAVAIALPGIADWLPGAAVPKHHGPTAIFSLRDNALEAAISDGMIFYLHCQPFYRGIQAWSLGNGPALENTVKF